MTYKETLNIINDIVNDLKNILEKNPKYILSGPPNCKYFKNTSSYLASLITKRLDTPWLSEDEIKQIYNEEIKIKKTGKRNIYYQINDNKIYSSVMQECMYLDNNGILNIYLKLHFIGDIDKYYNPYILIKLNLLQDLILMKLSEGIEIKLDDLCDINNLPQQKRVVFE